MLATHGVGMFTGTISTRTAGDPRGWYVYWNYIHQDDWRPTGLVCLLELYPPGRLATHGVGMFTGTLSTRTTGDPRGWYVYWNYIHQDDWRPTGLVCLLELYPPGRLATHGVGMFTGTISTRTAGDPRGWYVDWNSIHLPLYTREHVTHTRPIADIKRRIC